MSPTISICIPTYNRAPMLEFLLGDLASQAATVPKGIFEIVVSDNASTDHTKDVLSHYDGEIPLKSIVQDKNTGGYVNFFRAFEASSGVFCLYCADDDKIDLGLVLKAAAYFEINSNLGAIYCPWMIESASTKFRQLSYFPTVDNTYINMGDYHRAVHVIVGGRLFPEIAIFRRSTIKYFPPHSDVAFWFFVAFAKILAHFDVMILDKNYAYYTSYLDHPAGRRMTPQAGNAQAASAWDSYRGGLEIFVRAAVRRNPMSSHSYGRMIMMIDEFVASRQVVAMRSKCKAGSYIDAYILSERISLFLPQDISPGLSEALMTAAAVERCYNLHFSDRVERQAQLVGGFPKPFVALLREHGMTWFGDGDVSAPKICWIDDRSDLASDASAFRYIDHLMI